MCLDRVTCVLFEKGFRSFPNVLGFGLQGGEREVGSVTGKKGMSNTRSYRSMRDKEGGLLVGVEEGKSPSKICTHTRPRLPVERNRLRMSKKYNTKLIDESLHKGLGSIINLTGNRYEYHRVYKGNTVYSLPFIYE